MEGGSGPTSADDEAGSIPVRAWQPKGRPHKQVPVEPSTVKFASVQGILTGVREEVRRELISLGVRPHVPG